MRDQIQRFAERIDDMAVVIGKLRALAIVADMDAARADALFEMSEREWSRGRAMGLRTAAQILLRGKS